MVRGNYRGRGAFGGAGNPRGGGGYRGGGNGSGPLLTNHLRDLDIELQLLQRKRQIFEQEQNMLDRFANSTSNYLSANSNQYSSGSNHYSANSNNYSNNSNKRQYDNKQPFHNYSQQGTSNQFNFANHSAAYQPGPGSSNFKPQGVKRQAYAPVWQNQDPSPPKRFNAPRSINPWHNPATRQAEFRAVNQNPPQPKNFSAQTRSLMAQKPGIGQRITSKYNPPPERKNFKPNKVTKPNQRPAAKAPVYRPSIETKKLIDETNKLIAHTNKIVGQTPKPRGQNPPPKGQNPPPKGQNLPLKGQNLPTKVLPSLKKINTPSKSQNPAQNTIPKNKRFEQDNVLHPYKQPSGQIKGRLELALGMILKSVKELCPDLGTLEYFNIPFIQRVIKHTLRVRIRDVMMNEPIDNVRNIVDKYREKYPQTTDIELMKIAQDAHSYNNNQWRVLQLVEADDPEEFFKKNIGKILHNKLNDVFTDLQKLYENKDHKIEELVESFTKDDPRENKNEDETQGHENGGKNTSGEIATSEAKDTEGKMDTSEEKDSSVEIISIENEDTSGYKDTSVEKDTHGDKDKDGGKDSDEEKTTNDEKEKDTDQEGKDKNDEGAEEKKYEANSNIKYTEGSSEAIKMAVDQLQFKSSKTQKYVEFMEKVIEQKLPAMLHKFRDEFMSILCLDKEFTSMKALINLEMKLKLRQAMEKDNVITIDDDNDTSRSGKTSSPAMSTAAVNSNARKSGATAAKPAAPSPTTKAAATAAKPAAPSPTTKAAATAAKPAAPSPTTKAAATAAKPAAPSPTTKAAATAAKPAAPSPTTKAAAIAAKPAAASTTPAKPVADITTPAKPATTTEAVQPATPTQAVKPATPVKPATTPAKPVTAAGKPATPASTQSTPVTPAKAAEKSVPTTPKTPASKDIQYVKLIGSPALPARAVIYEFLKQFSPASIKKHKSINNLLVVGFADKEGFDKILAANDSVVGNATIIIKASEQVNTPGQNKTPQQNQVGQQGNKIPTQNNEIEQNKTNNQENKTQESVQNDETPAQIDTSKDITEEIKSTDANKLNSSTDDIISSDLDTQISDLLSSIRKADQEERADRNKLNGGEEMDTKDIDDEVAELTKNETDQSEETDRVGDKKPATDDSNTATKYLDTIMEVDDETKTTKEIAKAVEGVAKTAKESGRATPTRSSSRLANVTPSTIKTRRASRLANN